MNIRFLHAADLHAGITTYNRDMYPRLKDWENAFYSLIERVKQEQIPYVFLIGDLFHANIPDIETIVIVNKCLKELSLHVKKIFLVAGNHDINSISKVRHILEAITIDNVIVLDKTQVYYLDDCEFDIIHYHYLDLQKINYNLDKPHIVTFHGTVEGSCDDLGNMSKHSHVSANFLLSTNPKYVALGHIHKRQNLNDSIPVIYPGSFIQTSFSERNVIKGYLDVEIANDTISLQHIKTPYIEYQVINSVEELTVDNIKNKIIRIDCEFTTEHKELYKEILSEAYYVNFNYLVKRKPTANTETSYNENEDNIETLDIEVLMKQELDPEDIEFLNELVNSKEK